MPQEHIKNPDDPRLAPYRNVRDADLRGRDSLFLAEGRLVVHALLEHSRFHTQSVLISEKQRDAMALLLDSHPSTNVYITPQHIMNSIVGFDIHRGILAAGIRTEQPDIPSLLAAQTSNSAKPQLVLVLDALANHDNIGGIFRNAFAFGIHAVLLSPQCCDPLYRKSIRVSMGAALRVPFAQQLSTANSITLLRDAGYHIVALSPRADAMPLELFRTNLHLYDRIALCVGAEGPGLNENILDQSDAVVRIEMSPGIDSLNASVAVAIATHAITHFGRQ